MENETQLNRYKKLLQFIDEKFKEDINIPEIEEASNYSYRNINRIFKALNHETIGKYIKRTRLERAAQYLKFSHESITDIAYDVGFSNIVAFSKAFKSKFNCSPTTFRDGNKLIKHINKNVSQDTRNQNPIDLPFEIEELPEFQILGLEYQGSYEDISAIENTWKQLINYATKKKLLNKDTIYLDEILDDDEITDQINCRYTAAIIIEDSSDFLPEGFFKKKNVKSRKYAKFLHKGSHQTSVDSYNKIYSHWMTEVNLEMDDAPILEFYLNDEANTPSKELLTEIYIPVK